NRRTSMTKVAVTVGPEDHGKRMSLADFDHAEAKEGYLYELYRGVIIPSDVPKIRHLRQVGYLRHVLEVYAGQPVGQINTVAGGSECKILLWDQQTERHPDISIYKLPPPDEDNPWTNWVPEIVIDVVSPGSEQRDYEEKRQDYLLFGVREFWI